MSAVGTRLLVERRPGQAPWEYDHQSRLGTPLSPREQEVMVLVGEGLINKEIAHRLGISEQTVKNHVGSVLKRLGASNRMEAVRALGDMPDVASAIATHRQRWAFLRFAHDVRLALTRLEEELNDEVLLPHGERVVESDAVDRPRSSLSIDEIEAELAARLATGPADRPRPGRAASH